MCDRMLITSAHINSIRGTKPTNKRNTHRRWHSLSVCVCVCWAVFRSPTKITHVQLKEKRTEPQKRHNAHNAHVSRIAAGKMPRRVFIQM